MKSSRTRQFLFYLAAKLGKTITEIEAIPARELLEWAAYENLSQTAPEQTPDEMMLIAQQITAGANRGRR